MIRTIGGKPILLLAKEGGYSSSDEGRLADQFRGQVGAGPTDGAIVYRGVALIVTDDLADVRQFLQE